MRFPLGKKKKAFKPLEPGPKLVPGPPEIKGPEIRGPKIKGPEIKGLEIRPTKIKPIEVWKTLPVKHKILSVIAAVVTVSVIVPIIVFVIYPAIMGSSPFTLTPARDLTGTWRNPLSGQGFIVRNMISGDWVQYHDVEWKVKQSGNTIAGPMTITWVKGQIQRSSGDYTWPIVSPFWRQAALPKSVTIYLTGTVEGTKITIDWPYQVPYLPHQLLTGTFTTDFMTATMHVPSFITPGSSPPAPGEAPGPAAQEIPEFHAKLSLSRVR